MVMMDDERHRRRYNDARLACLLRQKDDSAAAKLTNYFCNIKLSKGDSFCKENEPYSCPLFVFIRNLKDGNEYPR